MYLLLNYLFKISLFILIIVLFSGEYTILFTTSTAALVVSCSHTSFQLKTWLPNRLFIQILKIKLLANLYPNYFSTSSPSTIICISPPRDPEWLTLSFKHTHISSSHVRCILCRNRANTLLKLDILDTRTVLGQSCKMRSLQAICVNGPVFGCNFQSFYTLVIFVYFFVIGFRALFYIF